MSWDSVYRLVQQIPRGRVATYGAIAQALRLPGGARAVGYAMAACPNGRGIPWHRVIGAGGRTRMPEPHASLQRRLLSSERVAVDGNKIDMKLYGWTPQKSPGNSRKSKRKPARRAKPKLRA
ncbi:MAG TPA: MGMT family protein [Candidatus Acidoferrales bacterium]|jgi:methylated-DNA-protein-cysteine methyltransferase-like protein|nr:MGMT family protein [Candidatus Acidoferrales bacterium]